MPPKRWSRRASPRSVTVPGALGGWQELAVRHGRLGLDSCLADSIDVAERGFAVAERTAAAWSASSTSAGWAAAVVPPELAPPPRRGDLIVQAQLAATLRAIAEHGPDAFYRGAVAEAICTASWLEEDLAAYRARWVEPLRLSYRGVDVLELPPPTQGVAALEALGLLDGHEASGLPAQIDSIRLALEDARARVGRRRRQRAPRTGVPRAPSA